MWIENRFYRSNNSSLTDWVCFRVGPGGCHWKPPRKNTLSFQKINASQLGGRDPESSQLKNNMFRTSGTNSKVIELIFLYVSQPWGAEEPSGVFSEFGSKMIVLRILKGLGVGPGSATERWPCRKNAHKSAFFRNKIKIIQFGFGLRPLTRRCTWHIETLFNLMVPHFFSNFFKVHIKGGSKSQNDACGFFN